MVDLFGRFNRISTFVGYLMPNPSFKKNSSCTIWPITGRIRGFIPFTKGICPKVNVIARLQFELAYYDSAVHSFNHYITWVVEKCKLWEIFRRFWYMFGEKCSSQKNCLQRDKTWICQYELKSKKQSMVFLVKKNFRTERRSCWQSSGA